MKENKKYWPEIIFIIVFILMCILFSDRKARASQLYIVTCYAGSVTVYHEYATIEQYENGFFQVDNGREKIKLNLHCMIRNK